ncbi:hypothetical protein FOA52_011169 [Chlamydomonas sp. UWO 241]|nr:hypothetical protein FOA52_011169 [Chlamydomonas sp. UWO 241]
MAAQPLLPQHRVSCISRAAKRGSGKPVQRGQTRRQRTASYLDEEDVDPEELLRELNSSELDGMDMEWAQDDADGLGEGEEGAARTWGTDGIDAFARSRMQEQGASDAEDDEEEDSDGGSSRSRGGGSSSSSGGGGGGGSGNDSGRGLAWAPAVPGGASALAGDPSTLVLDALYARRNPGVVSVLRSQGRTVLVPDADAEDDGAADGADADDDDDEDGGDFWDDAEEEEQEEEGASLQGARARAPGGGAGANAGGTRAQRRAQLGQRDSGGLTQAGEEFEPPVSRSGSKRGGGGGGGASADWFDALAAAGFSMKTEKGGGAGGRGGEVFLQRTVKGARAGGGAAKQRARPLAVADGVVDVGKAPQDDVASLSSYRGALRSLSTTDQLLDSLSLLHPFWAANGCRLVHPGTAQAVIDAPTPGAAGAALRCVALIVRSQRLTTGACMSLCEDARVQGLVECLRVGPPRLVPQQSADMALQTALSSAAREYWLGGAADAGGALGTGKLGDPSGAGAWGLEASASARAPSSSGSPTPTTSTSASAAPPAGGAAVDELGDEYARLVAKYATGASSNGSGSNGSSSSSSSSSNGKYATGASSNSNNGSSSSSGRNGSSSGSIDARAITQAKADAFAGSVWALSVLGGPALFAQEVEALMRVARLSVWRLAPGDVADVAWALAHARHHTPRLADLEDTIARMGGLGSFTPAEASRMLWAFATLAHTPTRLLQGLSPEWNWQLPAWRRQHRGVKTKGSISDFTPSQLSSAVWALACLQQVDTAPFRRAWGELKSRGSHVYAAEGPVALTQIWQAALAIKLEARWAQQGAQGAPAVAAAAAEQPLPAGQKLAEAGGKKKGGKGGGGKKAAGLALGLADEEDADVAKLLSLARGAFLSQTTALRKKVHSSYQRSIANVLTRSRTMHLLEDNSSGYAVDVSLPGARVAIEADGPTHIARNDGARMLGATAMKRRHLEAMGWSVINITFEEWDRLESAERRHAYLQAAISDALDDQLAPPSADAPLAPESDAGLGMWTAVLAKSMNRGDPNYLSYSSFSAHAGTHINMPSHCDKDLMTGPWGTGPNAHEADLSVLMGPALVVAVPPGSHVTAAVLRSLSVPPDTKRLLLRTDNSDRRLMGLTPFDGSYTGLTPDGAEFLAASLPHVRLLGVDYINAAAYADVRATQQALSRSGLLVVEGLELGGVVPGRYTLTCLPLKFKGVEAAPVRCVLRNDAAAAA